MALYKAVSLLFGIMFTGSFALELLRPGSVNVGELPGGAAYVGTLGLLLAVGGAALALHSWLRRRVCRVVGNQAGLQLLGRPGRAVAWSEVASVSKALPNLLGGFYRLRLVDGTEVYFPIEHEAPAFATLGSWAAAPPAFEQLCRQHHVWVG